MNTHWKQISVSLVVCSAFLAGTAIAGRFGGGRGGGFHGGGLQGGGARLAGGGAMPHVPVSRPAPVARARPAVASSVHGPYGGTIGGARAANARPATAARAAGRPTTASTQRLGGDGAGQRHAWETPRGGTIYGGGSRGPVGGKGAYVYTGPKGAVAVGGGKGGSITGPGGRDIAAGRHGNVVIGPNGNVHAGGGKGAAVKGPGGAAIAGSRGSVTVGPGGATARASRGGAAVGPGGAIAGGSRGAVAVGPNGAVAAGGRAVAGRGVYGAGAAGTRFVAASDLRGQGAIVRNNFGYYNSFTPRWYTNHPGAWFAAGWVAGSVWNACTWYDCASYIGYPEDTSAVYYNYGDNVTYQDGAVYYDGQQYATEEEYAEQATEIAAAGEDAQPAEEEKWQSLGIFAMVKGDETTSNDIFQLALNKDGIVRGNYYNALTDATTPVSGSLDKKTQRLAWTLDGKPNAVFDTGLYNLTQDETTMLVHFGKERTEQYKLFRVQQGEQAAEQAQAAQPATAPASP